MDGGVTHETGVGVAGVGRLSPMLDASGRRDAALSVAEEAVHLHRELASARADEFLPDLALTGVIAAPVARE